ncbi:MAG: acetolactate synthase small subunit [Candidatus Omnitrophica bacterium]|nr:acetolactate synthase small subunit [Candidatus Omnitrophota bacterium]
MPKKKNGQTQKRKIGRHIITALVENHFGVLAHVSGLFSARGFNIASLAVGETEDPTVSRMTIVVEADDRTLEQVKKQLNRLIDVIKVVELTGKDFIDRELILVKVKISSKTRAEIIQIVDVFDAKIVQATDQTITIEATGDQQKTQAFLELLEKYGIAEVVRTGRIAMER